MIVQGSVYETYVLLEKIRVIESHNEYVRLIKGFAIELWIEQTHKDQKKKNVWLSDQTQAACWIRH